MRRIIKLKCNDLLRELIEEPEDLSAMISIAMNADSKGKCEIGSVNVGEDSVERLFLRGLLDIRDGNLIVAGSMFDLGLKKEIRKESDLSKCLMSEVREVDVPRKNLEYFRIARAFQELFRGNLDSLEIRTINIDEAKYKKWVDPIRLMIESDKITVDQIREVWGFLKGHYFWSANVQSTSKLRDKFQTIHSQIKNNEGKGKKGNSSNISTEYINGILKDLQS